MMLVLTPEDGDGFTVAPGSGHFSCTAKSTFLQRMSFDRIRITYLAHERRET